LRQFGSQKKLVNIDHCLITTVILVPSILMHIVLLVKKI
jgi:hypothetical protein